jgi:subtilisin family serine protease
LGASVRGDERRRAIRIMTNRGSETGARKMVGMRRTALLLFPMFLAVVLVGGMAPAQTLPGEPHDAPQTQSVEGRIIPGEYIVVLKEDAPASARAANELAPRYRLDIQRTYQSALKGFAARIPAGRLEAVKADPRVLFISQNRAFSAVSHRQAADPVERIGGLQSSARSGNGAGSVRAGIAILDTGIDPRHRDLNVAGGVDCTSSGGFDDGNSHGTLVAGMAAARDNLFGVVGAAPGASLYAVKVLNDGGNGTLASVLCGVGWVTATSEKVDVANMSLTGSGFDDEECGRKGGDALHFAICNSVEEGVTYVAAAGNGSENLKITTPAAYDEILTVTAMTDTDGEPGGDGPRPACEPHERDDTRAYFSNFTTLGSDDASHTVAAPGVCNRSTHPGNSYARSTGTSIASPLVVGTAALYKARHPNATPARVIERVRAQAKEEPASYGFVGDPRSPLGKRYYGYLVHAGDF